MSKSLYYVFTAGKDDRHICTIKEYYMAFVRVMDTTKRRVKLEGSTIWFAGMG